MPALTPDTFIVEYGGATNPTGAKTTEWISTAGGLTQFGAFVETLQPGSRTSMKHWHSSEDEMVYVLDGEITLIEGDSEVILRRGDAATFKAAEPVGHYLINRSGSPTRCLVMGTRAEADTITYPDHDRICTRSTGQDYGIWTDSAGNPSNTAYDP